MSIIPWRNKGRTVPAEGSPLTALRGEMDRLFDSFFREPLGTLDWPGGPEGAFAPPIEVAESDREVMVRAELPGIDPKDLDVTISGNMLVLSGEKKEATERKEKDYHLSEIRFGSFRRSVRLPEGIDPNQVQAQHANGVLTLTIQKSQVAAPKKIEIKAQ
ncbi:MAG: Hsp20/alpha crystallin family protein [Planctomycetota bacterium]